MPASAPISEVLAVMPSVTMSCTPMIAPTTQSGAISSSEASSRKRGWMRDRSRCGCRRSRPVRSLLPQNVRSPSPQPPPARGGGARCAAFTPPPCPRRSATRSRAPRLPATRCLPPRPVSTSAAGRARGSPKPAPPASRTSTIRSVRVSVTSSPVPQSCTTLPSAIEHHAAHAAARQAAVQSLHRDADAFRIDRRQRRQSVVVQLAQPRAHAAAAAMLARRRRNR